MKLYQVIHSQSLEEFDILISNIIDEGWELLGGIMTNTTESGTDYLQAAIRELTKDEALALSKLAALK